MRFIALFSCRFQREQHAVSVVIAFEVATRATGVHDAGRILNLLF